MSLIHDAPYTLPDEDPFGRQSTMLDRWIHEQHNHLPPFSIPACARSNPYLAYPDLARAPSLDDVESMISYDLVEDDDIPSTIVTPKRSNRNSLTPSFRNISLSFRPPTPSPRTFSRLSLFPRTPRSSAATPHARSSSLTTLNISSSHTLQPPPTTPTPKWRPTVLGHFYQPTASESSVHVSDHQYTPSRPSISSADTHSITNTNTTTTVESTINSVPSPHKPSLFNTIRLRRKASVSLSFLPDPTLSSNSVVLGKHHKSASLSSDCLNGSVSRRMPFASKSGHTLDNIDDEDDLDPPPTFRPNKQLARPPIPHASGSLPRVKFSSLNIRSQRKRKKLVISGIAAAETRKFEGVKRWCESFGEVRNITRVPNGDLHIDFRDPEVADTVCRVRAKVSITGVGSVQLSWVYANKR